MGSALQGAVIATAKREACRGLAKSSVSQLQFKITVEMVNHAVKNARLGIGSAHRRACTEVSMPRSGELCDHGCQSAEYRGRSSLLLVLSALAQ
jgi:hypothetical protein